MSVITNVRQYFLVNEDNYLIVKIGRLNFLNLLIPRSTLKTMLKN